MFTKKVPLIFLLFCILFSHSFAIKSLEELQVGGVYEMELLTGEVLEGVAQSLPEGLKNRFASNGIRGIFGKPGRGGEFREMAEQLAELVRDHLGTKKKRELPFGEALKVLEENSANNEAQNQALSLLKNANEGGMFDEVPFENVWSLLQATAKVAD